MRYLILIQSNQQSREVWEGGFDGQPILGGGDLATLFTLNDDTVKVMEFLTSDAFGGEWAAAGGWLSPHRTFDQSLYSDSITQQVAKIASEAQVFRYDGSDLMPTAVGAGSFWIGPPPITPIRCALSVIRWRRLSQTGWSATTLPA